MPDQVREQWRILAVMVALALLAVGALAAGVAVLAQEPGSQAGRQPVAQPAAVNGAPESGAEAATSPGVAQPQAQPTPPPPQGATYHTVRSGETLGIIAAQYGLSTAAVANANGLANPNLIRVGQRLIIPAR